MYRHLLVPVDGTDLSTEAVGRAVELACSLGARITFFHARPNHSAFLCAYDGRARELTSKAEAAARALGVPCESTSAVSDTPDLAIIEAARAAGCDLIFMASHGRRSNLGMRPGSQTWEVFRNAEVSVLVAATADPGASGRVIGIIRDEHRSLSAALHAWMHLLASARRGNAAPDRALMRAIVHFIRMFPVAVHHPKEEEFLFRRLRRRTAAVDAELDELERQHARDRQLVEELAAMVERLEPGEDALAALASAVGHYATFAWEHMGREEGVILPAAQRHLTADDWAEIEAAFSPNGDQGLGGDADAEFRRLFSRIVDLAA